MLKVSEVIIVEGRYDKNLLSQIVDATIITTEGFGIFKDKDKQAMLRSLAERRGLVILTDSDGAGFVIRNFLKGCVDPKYIKHAYIPDILGKEKRKTAPSREGKLGVEGMSPEVIISALEKAGVGAESSEQKDDEITKPYLYSLGLFGGESSAQKRKALQKALSLPEHLSTNSLTQILNIVSTREEIERIIANGQ